MVHVPGGGDVAKKGWSKALGGVSKVLGPLMWAFMAYQLASAIGGQGYKRRMGSIEGADTLLGFMGGQDQLKRQAGKLEEMASGAELATAKSDRGELMQALRDNAPILSLLSAPPTRQIDPSIALGAQLSR